MTPCFDFAAGWCLLCNGLRLHVLLFKHCLLDLKAVAIAGEGEVVLCFLNYWYDHLLSEHVKQNTWSLCRSVCSSACKREVFLFLEALVVYNACRVNIWYTCDLQREVLHTFMPHEHWQYSTVISSQLQQ